MRLSFRTGRWKTCGKNYANTRLFGTRTRRFTELSRRAERARTRDSRVSDASLSVMRPSTSPSHERVRAIDARRYSLWAPIKKSLKQFVLPSVWRGWYRFGFVAIRNGPDEVLLLASSASHFSTSSGESVGTGRRDVIVRGWLFHRADNGCTAGTCVRCVGSHDTPGHCQCAPRRHPLFRFGSHGCARPSYSPSDRSHD